MGISLIYDQLIIHTLDFTMLPRGSQRNLPKSLTHVQLRLVALWVLISPSRDAAVPTESSQGKILDVQSLQTGCYCLFSLVLLLGIARLLGVKSMALCAVRLWGMHISPGHIT